MNHTSRSFRIIIIFVISVFMSVPGSFAADKQKAVVLKPVQITYNEHVLQLGRLHNYVSNTTYDIASNRNYHSFIIGRPDLEYPSMQWLEGGYAENHYLYFGVFWITYNGNPIRFSTETSDDFRNTKASPCEEVVTFSLSDALADTLHVGVKCLCRVHGYADISRQDVLVYEYEIINRSADTLAGVYCGLQMDADISSAGGGEGSSVFWRDDMPGYYLGTDHNGNPESISYMYDEDSYEIPGDDTGGRFSPKESLGYLGSRVILSPPTTHGVPANQASGHYWWDWGSDPEFRTFERLMQREEFRAPPGSPHDFRYLQSVGPYDIENGDTLALAFAIGIGNGVEELRKNLQAANDLYAAKHIGPKITAFSPDTEKQIVYFGESCTFTISAKPGYDKRLIYTWHIDDMISAKRDSFFVFYSADFDTGDHDLFAEVSGERYSSWHYWQVTVKPAKKFILYNNYPNPFNGMTKIPFELKESGRVHLVIYDVRGRIVKKIIDQSMDFGEHEAVWDGRDEQGNNSASGVYFYQLTAASANGGNLIETKKLLYLK